MSATKPVALGTQQEVAEFLGVPPRTLAEWRYRGIGPKYARVGRYVRYRWDDVEKYVNEQTAEASQ